MGSWFLLQFCSVEIHSLSWRGLDFSWWINFPRALAPDEFWSPKVPVAFPLWVSAFCHLQREFSSLDALRLGEEREHVFSGVHVHSILFFLEWMPQALACCVSGLFSIHLN